MNFLFWNNLKGFRYFVKILINQNDDPNIYIAENGCKIGSKKKRIKEYKSYMYFFRFKV